MLTYISLTILFLASIITIFFDSKVDKNSKQKKITKIGWILFVLIILSFFISIFSTYENNLKSEFKIKNDKEKYNYQINSMKKLDSLQRVNFKNQIEISKNQIQITKSESEILKLKADKAILELANNNSNLKKIKSEQEFTNYPLSPVEFNITFKYKLKSPLPLKLSKNSTLNFTLVNPIYSWMLGFTDSDNPCYESNTLEKNNMPLDSLQIENEIMNKWNDFSLIFIFDKDYFLGFDVLYDIFSDGKQTTNVDVLKNNFWYSEKDTILTQNVSITFNSLYNNRNNIKSLFDLLNNYYIKIHSEFFTKNTLNEEYFIFQNIKMVNKLKINYGTGLSMYKIYRLIPTQNENWGFCKIQNNQFVFSEIYKLKEIPICGDTTLLN